MFYKGYKTMYDFAKFKTIQSFGNAIGNGKITMDVANDEQEQLAEKLENLPVV